MKYKKKSVILKQYEKGEVAWRRRGSMAKAIIIGSGPAGISAALYTARGGVETTVISRGSGALGWQREPEGKRRRSKD